MPYTAEEMSEGRVALLGALKAVESTKHKCWIKIGGECYRPEDIQHEVMHNRLAGSSIVRRFLDDRTPTTSPSILGD